MNLLGTAEGQARKMATDPNDEPTAGDVPTAARRLARLEDDVRKARALLGEVPTREERLASALLDMMNAYERRVRTACTPEQLTKAPWRCAEYVTAEAILFLESSGT